VTGAIPGGDHRAVQNDDGTWNVFDVPIVAAGTVPLVDGTGKPVGERTIDADWMRAAIAASRRAERGRFMGRLHVHHHDDGDEVEDAGFIRPMRVGMSTEDGEDTLALFADLVAVPSEVFDRIRANRLPYRSIESLDPESGFIDSLALLPTRSPHCKLPMLTIGSEVGARAVANANNRDSHTNDSRLVASASSGKAITVLSRFTMKQIKAEAKPEDEKPKGEEKPAAKAEESKADPVDALLTKIAEMKLTREQHTKLEAGIAAIFGDEGKGAPDATGMDGPADQGGGKMAAAKTTDAAIRADAAHTAESLALRADVETLKSERDLGEAIDGMLTDLARYPLGSNPRAMLKAKAKEHGGLSGLKTWVEGFKASAPKAPPNGDADPAGEVAEAAEVAAYASKGTEVYAKARAAGAMYDAMPIALQNKSRAAFIKNRLYAAGIRE